MNTKRFVKQPPRRRRLGPLSSLLLPLALLAAFWVGTSALSRQNDAERLQTVEQSVVRAAVHCYAVEGVYPPDLDYLEQRYGLAIDHSRYAVDYRCFASNIAPEVTVLAR